MRIGILIDEYIPGAQPVLATQEARGLKQKGFDAEILVGTRLSENNLAEIPADISINFLIDKYPRWVRKIKFRFPFFSFFSPQHLLSAYFAPCAVKEREYDCIIAHGLFSVFIAANLRKKRSIPFATFFWDPSSYILPKVYSKTPLRLFSGAVIPIIRRIDIAMAKTSDRVMLGSKFHLDWFRKQGIKDIEVVYPGSIALEVLPKSRKNFVLAVDRWDIGSRPDMFLEILHSAKVKFRLKIVGHWHNEAFKQSFLSRVKQLGLEDYVEVEGHVTISRLQQFFQEAHCFVHPTIEAFGMAALEAASYGCPIIIPEGSGVTDLFIHGEHGFFPKENDIQAYAEYLEKLISDPVFAYKMGAAAWEVARKYSWDFHAQRLSDIIKDLPKR